jgi:hypothetical protein
MEIWIQESLFDASGLERPRPGSRLDSSKSGTVRRLRPASSVRVTRDPAVAASYTEAARAATDFRLGLARAFGQLTPEQRKAIRATLEAPARQSAA